MNRDETTVSNNCRRHLVSAFKLQSNEIKRSELKRQKRMYPTAPKTVKLVIHEHSFADTHLSMDKISQEVIN